MQFLIADLMLYSVLILNLMRWSGGDILFGCVLVVSCFDVDIFHSYVRRM